LIGDAPSRLGTAHAASTDDTSRDLGPLVESALRLMDLSGRAPAAIATLDGPRVKHATTESADEFARAMHGASLARSELEEARREGDRHGLKVGSLAGLLRVGVVLAGRGLQIERVSGGACELCGCADEAAFRQTWQMLGPLLRRSLDDSASGRRGGLPLLVELRPGHTVQAEVQRLEGSVEEYLVVLTDPRALEAVENDARLQRQLEGLGRVYRTLAHELRAPLGAVMLNLDLLQESLGGSEQRNDRARRLVGVLRRELDRLNRSLCGILTGTVPEASPERFDLAGSLRDLVALLAPQARRQSVELEVRLPDDPLPVHGYPDRLRQAFLNVAVNALEAMPHGGRLLLEARREGTWARVAVRDSGRGIPVAALPRVYDPEFTTKDGGSGIGLYVARAAVELHGGEIGVYSPPGQGTAVHVAVPLAAGAALA
jgi:signal transduction histidine kinase